MRELRCGDYYVTVFTKYHWMGMALGMTAGPDSVVFFSKTKPKVEKVYFLISPKHVAYFDFVLHSRFKTKRSLRSGVDRSTDRQQIDRTTDRQIKSSTDKMIL